MKIKLEPHYSGEQSSKFWELVNSLPEKEAAEMYFAGVLLQEMEEKVLSLLQQYVNIFPLNRDKE